MNRILITFYMHQLLSISFDKSCIMQLINRFELRQETVNKLSIQAIIDSSSDLLSSQQNGQKDYEKYKKI